MGNLWANKKNLEPRDGKEQARVHDVGEEYGVLEVVVAEKVLVED